MLTKYKKGDILYIVKDELYQVQEISDKYYALKYLAKHGGVWYVPITWVDGSWSLAKYRKTKLYKLLNGDQNEDD